MEQEKDNINFPHSDFKQALQLYNIDSDLFETAQQILPLIDLTSLNGDDTEEKINCLCKQAITKHGEVAAVCVYGDFVKLAKNLLSDGNVKVATVANFPNGDGKSDDILAEVENELDSGADEIDIVFPYKKYLAGDIKSVETLLTEYCNLCRKYKVMTKVILETGLFPNPQSIYKASCFLINVGVNFLKTSTGKVEINATPSASAAMLLAIRDINKKVGFKASGGIRTVQQANQYLQLANIIIGKDWISPDHFRFGASSLLHDVISVLGKHKIDN